jgi:Zn-dependent metalloprotease
MNKNQNNLTIAMAITFCVAVITAFWGCKKDGKDEKKEIDNYYCVTTIENSPTTTTLSESEMNEVKSLFNRNNLDYTKYKFTRFQEDDLDYHHIRCFQFVNNLIVFSNEIIFHFDKNDDYYYLSGNLIDTINLNTTPSMKHDEIAEKFVDRIKLDSFYKGDSDVLNGCFETEFGYYDLNAGRGDTTAKFTKAWKIKPKNKNCPFSYINDENSDIIYYDNCIRF